jgi:hypothetical protein
VLLSRQLLLLEQSATKAPSAGRPYHSPPMEVSANLASIRAAFLALHSFKCLHCDL